MPQRCPRGSALSITDTGAVGSVAVGFAKWFCANLRMSYGWERIWVGCPAFVIETGWQGDLGSGTGRCLGDRRERASALEQMLWGSRLLVISWDRVAVMCRR